MKKLLKRFTMTLCAMVVIVGTVGATTNTADAWGWKKTKVNKYHNSSYSKKYYSDDDMTKMAKIMDDTVIKGKKNLNDIRKYAIQGLFGGKPSALKDIIKKQNSTAAEATRATKKMNTLLKVSEFESIDLSD